MKRYKTVTIKKLEVETIYCNCCGREITFDDFGCREDYISINKKWGYNSSFDGKAHKFDVCDSCYKQWIRSFQYQPNEE